MSRPDTSVDTPVVTAVPPATVPAATAAAPATGAATGAATTPGTDAAVRIADDAPASRRLPTAPAGGSPEPAPEPAPDPDPASTAPVAGDRGDRLRRRVGLRTDVSLAATVLAPSWPLETFIAVNPLGGLENRPFAEAVQVAGEVLGARGTLDETAYRALRDAGRIDDDDLRTALRRRFDHDDVEPLLQDLLTGEPAPPPVRHRTALAEVDPAVAAKVERHLTTWLAAFLDAGQAGWSMPGAERGFYAAWRELAPASGLPRAARQVLRSLPERADDAVLDALEALGVDPAEQRAQLQAELAALPGWAGHVRWRADNGAGIDLVALLAVRLSCTWALLRRTVPPAPAPAPPEPPGHRDGRVPDSLRGLIWLEAHEAGYRDPLLRAMSALPPPVPSSVPTRPAAQLVTCIDVRSEGLRRALETRAGRAYETLGFAGFFAVAIAFTGLAGGAPNALCPVLLKPRNRVDETAAPGAGEQAERRVRGLAQLAGGEQSLSTAKQDLAGPFALAEATGWFAGPLSAAKTLLAGPYGRWRTSLGRRVAPPADTVVTALEGFDPGERAGFAEVALRMMGLTRSFGRLVVLCGHGSTTENNPYGSALDCGACGGGRGGPNARTAAALLNAPDVRAALAERGIVVPSDTWFVAGEHDTATDLVQLLDAHLVPDSHRGELAALTADLAEAGEALAAERCALLPGAPARPDAARAGSHVRARSTDWAQTYPEWGLAGNAAFLIGPRDMTRGLDLGRRTFLHSYETDADPDGSGLETILTAPLVVAQWISCQYYFSSVDPERFGSGSKTIHNVVGGIGVLAGHDGDLRAGLPWQSVGVGRTLVHEPLRLLAVVQAPLQRIEDIIARNSVLQLFDNDWVALAAREHATDPWQRHTPRGWEPWHHFDPREEHA